MLKTPIDKLKIINRNEELEHLYNTQKNLFKSPRKIEEFLLLFYLVEFKLYFLKAI